MIPCILVFGQTGQVARELARLAGSGQQVICLGRDKADLTDPDACAARVAATDADVVINAAAYTAVDKAEDEEQLAHAINVTGRSALKLPTSRVAN